MAKITIESHMPRLVLIGAGGKKGSEHPEIQIMPGSNFIEREHWQAVRDNAMPATEAMVANGELEEGEDDRDRELPRGAAPALKLIGSTYSIAQLQRWRESDNRPPIVAAIEKQIASLQSAKKPATAEE